MAEEGNVSDWQSFVSLRLPELTAQGLSSREAMQRVGQEWQEIKEGSAGSRGASSAGRRGRGGSVSKSGLKIDYIQTADGILSEAQAKDIALGLLDALIDRSDAEYSTEYAAMQRRAAELFGGGEEPSAADSAERKFGADLAEYLILAVISRRVPWSELEPAVLSGLREEAPGDAPALLLPPPASSMTPTAEQELGLAPRPTNPSLKSRVASSAVKRTIQGLEQILQQ